MVSGVEDLTDSQANMWANSWIVSPVVPFVKPVHHRPVIRSLSNSPSKLTASSLPRPCESPPQAKLTSQQKSCRFPAKPISTSSPKPTAKASPLVQLKQKTHHHHPMRKLIVPLYNALYNPLLTVPHYNPLLMNMYRALTKPNYNLSESTAAHTKPHTRSQSRDVGIHIGPSLTLGTKPNPRTSAPKKPSSSTSKCPPPFNPLYFAALGVDELLNFDVRSLCREPKWDIEENEWNDGRETEISIVGAHTEGGKVIVTYVNDNLAYNDDRDSEETGDVNDSEDVSLDEENNSSESGDDNQLEGKVDQRIDGDRVLVVNKMTRTLRGFADNHERVLHSRRLYIAKGLEKCYTYYFKENICHPLLQKFCITLSRFKFDTNLKCDDNINNFVESFNHTIDKFRGLPILTMFEEIRKFIGSRLVKRFENHKNGMASLFHICKRSC
ncbi:hypothetical protein Cgig2_021276 [Carnegiea gigantea]|uniref:Uncharacterized protein n=1 Tax=Carnegiea gigantea TaxID=171969 RepID=A0A9Q1JM94_9CARY|nr:hypothetical protein Cgig2_021276 [Carnegiea gigantea]